jgi:hypothetical protein
MVEFLREHGGHPMKIMAAALLELSARVYAKAYVALDKGDQAVWCQISTSKDVDARD